MNDVGGALSSGKAPLQQPLLYQSLNKLSSSSVSTSTNSTLFISETSKTASVPKLTSTSCPSLVPTVNVPTSIAPKQIISPATVLAISQPTRTTTCQPKGLGKHTLPIRSLPASIPHVVPRMTSVSTTLLDSCGAIKGVSALSTGAKAQHVLVAPGLRTPAPTTIKFAQPFHPGISTFNSLSYQFPNQQQATSSSSTGKPVTAVSTLKAQQPLVVKSIYPQPTTIRPPLPVAIVTSHDVTRRVTNPHQTTISISLPHRSIQQESIESNARISVTSGTGGKHVYQVGIAVTSSLSSVSLGAHKLSRKLTAQRAGSVIATSQTGCSISHGSTSTTSITSVSSFTYSAASPRLASITTSAVQVAKVFPQQPSVSGISAHVRTTEFQQYGSFLKQGQSAATTVHSSLANVTSLAPSSTGSSVMQPMIYMPHPTGISPSFPYPTQTASAYNSIRTNSILPASNPSGISPIRISQPLLVMEPRVNQNNSAAYTQGQSMIQAVSSSPAGVLESQPRLLQPQLSIGQGSTTSIQHIPNMSPKPAILRRPVRSDFSINKKLNFISDSKSTDRSSPVKSDRDAGNIAKPSLVQFENNYSIGSNIKPVLPGKVKQIVTSNGMGPGRKGVSSKDCNATTCIKTGNAEVVTSHTSRLTQLSTDHKFSVETEPPLSYTGKSDSVSCQISQQRVHSYHIQTTKAFDAGCGQHQVGHPSLHQPPGSKVRQLQQRSMVTVSAAPRINNNTHQRTDHGSSSPSLLGGVQIKQLHASVPLHSRCSGTDVQQEAKVKLKFSSLSGSLKRPFNKISSKMSTRDTPDAKQESSEKLLTNSATMNMIDSASPDVGLSPRKKPRKQTHIVAEELPFNFQMIDDEMSTDDADECEDEQPLVSLMNTQLASGKANNNKISGTASEPTSVFDASKPTEFTDKDGVRYVVSRERPPINLLNGHRSRAATNHFTHYSDIKVKEKRVNFHDQCFNIKRLNGWKVQHLATQLEQLMTLDADALSRLEHIKGDLVRHCQAMFNGPSSPVDASGAKSPAQILPIAPPGTVSTPTQTRNLASAFCKPLSSTIGEYGSSPLTPSERRISRLREELLKTEEMAQANIQRCSVMQEQLSEAKSLFVRGLENREFATRLVEAGRESQKNNKSIGPNSIRGTKKKKNS